MAPPPATPGAPPDTIDVDTVVLANAIEVLYAMQQSSHSLALGLLQNLVDEGFTDGRPDIQRDLKNHIPQQTEYIQKMVQSAYKAHREHKEKIQDQIEKLGNLKAMVTRARRSITGSSNMPSNAKQKLWLQNYDNGKEPGPVWLQSRTTSMQPPAPPASSDDRRFSNLWSGGSRMLHRQDAPPAEAPEVSAAGDNQIEPAAQAPEIIDY